MFGAGESHAQNKPSVVHPSISSSKPRLGACMPIACPTRHWFSASIGADGASLFVRSLGFFSRFLSRPKGCHRLPRRACCFEQGEICASSQVRRLCRRSSVCGGRGPIRNCLLVPERTFAAMRTCPCRPVKNTPRRRKPVECSAARGGSDPLLCVRAPSAVGTRAPLHSQGRYLVDPASSHMLVSKI